MGRTKVYRCSKCPQDFPKARFLSLHYITDHRIRTSSSLADQNQPSATICHYCDHRFNAEIGLTHHLTKNKECNARHRAHLSSSYAGEHEQDDRTQDDTSAGSSRERIEVDAEVDEELEDSDGGLQYMDIVSDFEGEEEEYAPAMGDTHMAASDCAEDEQPDTKQLRGTETFVEHYPKPTAGTPIRRATPGERLRRDHASVGRLGDPELFEVAEILITSGLSAKKRNKFLRLNRFNGCTPWRNNQELMQDVDNLLPRGPKWRIKTIEVVGSKGTEKVEFWVRNTLEGIRDLLYDSQFEHDIQYRAVKHWTSPERCTRKWGETYAGRHMWRVQDAIPDPHATVVPTFLASDETTLTVFVGDKKAHPVYLTIGNIPKHIRRQTSKRAMILVGYLPVTKLECEPNVERRRLLKRKLFHQCMSELVAPLAEACKEGAEAVCSDGGIRRIYPVFSGAMLDFPEQCKYACIKQSFCPTCEVPPDERGELTTYPLRERGDTVASMEQHEQEGSVRFEELGLIPVSPFWADLPYVDASLMCPPDLLHQLYKGVFKDHLSKWSAHIVGKGRVDNMYKAMSPHHGLRHFKRGILGVTHWTGREVKEQAKVFLPTIANEAPEVIAAGRAVLDFMYLAHSSSLDDDDLQAMDDAVETFHQNKNVFKARGASGQNNEENTDELAKCFNGIPKLHAMQHYTHFIQELGTPDGFNTELPERLHIPYAKQGYRASNRKEATKQMAVYIQRMEAIAMHRAYLDQLESARSYSSDADEGEDDEDDDFGGSDAVDFEPMQRLSLGDHVEEPVEDEDEEGEEEEGRGEGMVAEPVIVDDEATDETVLEETDVGGIGTWEEETNNNPAPRGDGVIEVTPSSFYPNPDLRIAKAPTAEHLHTHLTNKHATSQLWPVITTFFKKLGHTLSPSDINTAKNLKFKVWYRYRMFHSPPPFKPTEGEKVDVVRASPAVEDQYGRIRRQEQFDTVLCLVHPLKTGINRYRAARVCAIFELPANLRCLFPGKLAYVEFFTDFTGPDPATGLYRTAHKLTNTRRNTAVVPLSTIRMTCHLPPRYGTATQHLDLAAETDILQSCQKFFFNEFGNFFTFELLRHWLRTGAME